MSKALTQGWWDEWCCLRELQSVLEDGEGRVLESLRTEEGGGGCLSRDERRRIMMLLRKRRDEAGVVEGSDL